jgi:hypothetical protein
VFFDCLGRTSNELNGGNYSVGETLECGGEVVLNPGVTLYRKVMKGIY